MQKHSLKEIEVSIDLQSKANQLDKIGLHTVSGESKIIMNKEILCS